jgi:hypothetical protein
MELRDANMANRWMGAALVCGWLAATAVADGQEYGEPTPVGNCGADAQPIPGPLTTAYAPQGPPDCMSLPGNLPNASTLPGCGQPAPCCPVGYVSAEYLLWWLKKPTLSEPLLTTALPGSGGTGVLGNPNTVVLLDRGTLDYNPQSGGRVTAGIWFDCSHVLALEGSGFLFERKPVGFSRFSNVLGEPLLAVPFVNVTPGQANGPAVQQLSAPNVATGGLTVDTSNQFWGAESNLILNACGCGDCTCGFHLSFLAGFRYLDYSEQTTIDAFTGPIGAPPPLVSNDVFHAHDRFYGGQVGTRFGLSLCHFFFAGEAKFAMGCNHETSDAAGVTQNPVGTTVPAGFFVVGSNEGRFTRDRFTYVPEAEGRIGYQFTPHISMWAGYTLLYWNQMLRSGQQLDPNIDLRQVPPPFGQATGVPVPGAVFPRTLFNETSFWAQGINVGLEFIY